MSVNAEREREEKAIFLALLRKSNPRCHILFQKLFFFAVESIANNHLRVATACPIMATILRSYKWAFTTRMASKQRPPVNNGQYFGSQAWSLNTGWIHYNYVVSRIGKCKKIHRTVVKAIAHAMWQHCLNN